MAKIECHHCGGAVIKRSEDLSCMICGRLKATKRNLVKEEKKDDDSWWKPKPKEITAN